MHPRRKASGVSTPTPRGRSAHGARASLGAEGLAGHKGPRHEPVQLVQHLVQVPPAEELPRPGAALLRITRSRSRTTWHVRVEDSALRAGMLAQVGACSKSSSTNTPERLIGVCLQKNGAREQSPP